MTQAEALKIMLSGANVFLTGAPGAGKSYLLDQFIREVEAKGKDVAVTASTGIAAIQIGGRTIHSWSATGIAEELSDEDWFKIKRSKKVKDRIQNCDVLIIDEVSMLHGNRLNMVNEVCKVVRENRREPFGGLQVILVGDMFQLPPVTRGSDTFDFVQYSEAWDELNLKVCYLTEQHRQDKNDMLLVILEAMRKNNVTPVQIGALKARIGKEHDEMAITRLYAHNVDVDKLNRERLNQLPGKAKKYRMTWWGEKYNVETLKRNVLAPEVLELKKDAEVMFVANNFDKGYVNGSRGKVVKFNEDGQPVVKLQSNGQHITVEIKKWNIEEGEDVIAQVKQLPLRLAWAITIHKSQGMTLDGAEIDLTRAFTPGMGYVALSRVKSFDQLYLKGMNEMAMKLNDEIFAFDAEMRERSEVK